MRPSMSALGWPTEPKPPTSTVAPLGMSESASATPDTRLSIIASYLEKYRFAFALEPNFEMPNRELVAGRAHGAREEGGPARGVDAEQHRIALVRRVALEVGAGDQGLEEAPGVDHDGEVGSPLLISLVGAQGANVE